MGLNLIRVREPAIHAAEVTDQLGQILQRRSGKPIRLQPK
jgi:hypothetical protein